MAAIVPVIKGIDMIMVSKEFPMGPFFLELRVPEIPFAHTKSHGQALAARESGKASV